MSHFYISSSFLNWTSTLSPTRLDPPEEVIRHFHDVGAIANDFETSDSLDCQHLYTQLQRLPTSTARVDRYQVMNIVNVPLSTLQRTYEQQNWRKALNQFSYRSNLQIDDHFIVPNDSLEYCFSCSKTYLDFIMIVGSEIGIDMFIPNVIADHTFGFRLNLRLNMKEFRAKQGTLGFNPSGSMVCLSQTATEDLWIGMAPRTFFEEAEPRFDMSQKHGNTRLSGRHHRMLLIFLIEMLTKVQDQAFYLFDQYEIDIEYGYDDLERNTNAL